MPRVVWYDIAEAANVRISIPSRRSRSRHPADLPLRNNPLEEARNYFKLKTILGNPNFGDAGAAAPIKGVFGRKVLRQSSAAPSVEAPYVPPGTITQARQTCAGNSHSGDHDERNNQNPWP